MNLNEFFKNTPRAAIAFSGGVDSSYLLYAAKKAGIDIKAYYVKTAFQPQFELEDAKQLTRDLNAAMDIIELDILSDKAVADNPPNRCYFCKRKIFAAIKERAAADGYETILDGTNASDRADDRPGMKALAEMKVLSPLKACGLTKDEIRELSKSAGLFTWDKPAYACLATRIPAGDKITSEMLKRTENAEDALFKLGFTNFRVRIFHGAARLQFSRSQIENAFDARDAVEKALSPYFDTILFDLKGR